MKLLNLYYFCTGSVFLLHIKRVFQKSQKSIKNASNKNLVIIKKLLPWKIEKFHKIIPNNPDSIFKFLKISLSSSEDIRYKIICRLLQNAKSDIVHKL